MQSANTQTLCTTLLIFANTLDPHAKGSGDVGVDQGLPASPKSPLCPEQPR